MTFYEKYPQLQNKEFLTEILTDTVFTSMSLEDQQVPKPKVQEIVSALLEEQELQSDKFIQNKAV